MTLLAPHATVRSLAGRDFLKEIDLTVEEWRSLVALAAELKMERRLPGRAPRLPGRSIALLFEKGLQTWDMAAGSLLVTEAGGIVGNFAGESDYLYKGNVLAGTPKIFAQMVALLSQFSK